MVWYGGENAAVDATGEALLASLTEQRRHVLGILADLSDADLRRPVLPTAWSCIGLVHHLALDVERFWFSAVMADQPAAWASLDRLEQSAWLVPDDVPPAQVLGIYREEISRSNAVIETTPIDAPPGRWPTELFPSFLADLRAVLLHVITETACHAGHLDAARELMDRRTWMVL
jgi:Protein of unknown function (DUF664)